MSAIFKYLQEFWQKEYKLSYFTVILLLSALGIYINYRYGLDAQITAAGNTRWQVFGSRYLLYFIPFAGAFLLQLFFYSNCNYIKNPWFWVILVLAPAFFSFRVQFQWHYSFINNWLDGDLQIFIQRCADLVIRVFVLLIPVYITWYIKDKKNQPFYGAAPVKDVKPYFLLLLMMIPLILIAVTQNDFLHMYPRAKFLEALDLSSKNGYYFLFELCYGFDFVSIEFFFRGFLILSLIKICGAHCIIPAACFYCAIHLGKPAGEAISSFWGGLLLGIISYNTKSIWGGLIVHLGIAWFMEAGSALSLLFKK